MIATAIKKLVQRPKAEQAARITLVAESHAGHHGYAVFENGQRMAWGANQTAAVAAYQVSKAGSTTR